MIDQADQAQTRLAMAALFAALVRALEMRASISRTEVELELGKIYGSLRDSNSPTSVLETLDWARSLMRAS
jgi:hypothetical protein